MEGGEKNEPSLGKRISSVSSNMPMTLEMPLSERLTRASGAIAAAIAIAPQARTEKTAEKRILTERLK